MKLNIEVARLVCIIFHVCRNAIPIALLMFVVSCSSEEIKKSDIEIKHRLGVTYIKNGEMDKAFIIFDELKDRGCVTAMHNLAYIYEFKGDFDNAIHWYKKACDGGFVLSGYSIGLLYLKGKFKRVDYDEAKRWISLAADGGNVDAIVLLGRMYYDGMGVGVDFVKAFELFERGYKEGSPIAAYNIACLYFRGEGVNQDCKMALKYALESSQNGYCSSNKLIGEIYRSGCLGYVDEKKAKEFLLKKRTDDCIEVGMDFIM